MTEFFKCECSSCGQPIEYPSEGTGMIVPCPSCQNPVALNSKIVSFDTNFSPVPQITEIIKKPTRSNLTKLTHETIRTKTKSGDTPLHRAAKNGQFGLIPSGLLSFELFLEKNNAGETPLHVAAKNGHLNQVPEAFLTSETLTIRTSPSYAPQSAYLTGSGKMVQTETVLHIAARYRHTDQIPREFLAVEFLSLVATGYENNLLEIIFLSDQLDAIPDINTNAEIWSLKTSHGQTLNDLIENKRRRDAYIGKVRSEPATEKQKAKLGWFGYPLADGMTKGEASDAIDKCVTQFPDKDREYYNRPATEEQISQIREYSKADEDLLVTLEELEQEGEILTYGEAKDLLRDCEREAEQKEIDQFRNPPDEAQCQQLESLGFKLDKKLEDIITAADVDAILSLKGSSVREEDLNLFEQHGITYFQGDGLSAFALSSLIRSLGGSAQSHNRKNMDYVTACKTAVNDPDYQTPTLTRDWEGFVEFAWPKKKIEEWSRSSEVG
jgi:hypothetical protein